MIPPGHSTFGVLCRDAEESARFDLMAKYAGSDTTAGAHSSAGMRFSVLRMARLLKVSTSGYYAHVKRAAATVLTPRQQRRADLAVKILDVHADSDGTYGSPRITTELRNAAKRSAGRPSQRPWQRSGSRASAPAPSKSARR